MTNCSKCGKSPCECAGLRTVPASSPHSSSSTPSLSGRFVVGAGIASGRYRILGLLGEGGMGEVYKAEDLKLRQVVALKFLPSATAFDPQALARFHNEVRVARQVAHPSVCRVYDIGEENGLHFLSMEFIDGEDLASLLRRIGRLPGDKAAELGRQICAGLAAAHDQGVLHRDLKPANIMIDGRGNARITDFGLAVLNEEVRGDAARSGTPAYMAPEQLAGLEASARSDIYSLGLVLYEMFTGRAAFEAQSWQEFHKLHESSAPATPSSYVKDIDPLAERVILRCLEKDPQKRPRTAAQVGIALPGGDPLQAALAAGETPSPEMVAAAPKTGSLRPVTAGLILATTFVLLIALLFSNTRVHSKVPLRKSPEVLAERASELASSFGYGNAVDRAFGFSVDQSYWAYAVKQNQTADYWTRIQSGQPLVYYFWYRQSPRYFIGKSFFVGDVSLPDPPLDLPGMVSMILYIRGRLVEFNAVPPLVVSEQSTKAADWGPLFSAAGIAASAIKPTPSLWNPPVYADTKQAWSGFHPDLSDVPVRVEAASNQGRAVYFRVVAPWDGIERITRSLPSSGTDAGFLFAVVFIGAVALVAVFLARINLRRGRGDRQGAIKIAAFVAVLQIPALIRAHHVPTLDELAILRDVAFVALLEALCVWIVYLALEPFVRRYWPAILVGWTRLLSGDFRDPMVGRDILAGGLLGIIGHPLTIEWGRRWEQSIGKGIPIAFRPAENWRELLSFTGGAFESALLSCLFGLLFLLLAFLMVRRDWVAALIFGAVLYLYICIVYATSWPIYIVNVVQVAAVTITIWRFGLLASVVYQIYFHLVYATPLTTDTSLWYSGNGFLMLGLAAALSTFGFYVSLGGKKIFENRLLAD